MAFITAVFPMMILGILLEAIINPIGFIHMLAQAIIEMINSLPF